MIHRFLSRPFHAPAPRARRDKDRQRTVLFEPLEQRALLAAGDLNPTFGENGLATVPFFQPEVGEDPFYALYETPIFQASLIQPDGKLLAGGNKTLARYREDGSADYSFGDFGLASFPGIVTGMALQEDGSIVVSGFDPYVPGSGGRLGSIDIGSVQPSSGEPGFIVARYRPDGALDVSFDGDGIAVASFGGVRSTYVSSIVVQPDQKIVVVGTVYTSTLDPNFAVARFNPNGSLDATFGQAGVATTSSLGSLTRARGVALQEDGKIVVVGIIGASAGTARGAVARFTSEGTLDDSFQGGIASPTLGTRRLPDLGDVVIQPSGRIVVAPTIGLLDGGLPGAFLVGLDASGELDPTFGSQGSTPFPGDVNLKDIALQADGRIIAAGWHESVEFTAEFAVARYTVDGELDTSFGDHGHVTTPFSAEYRRAGAYSVAVGQERIVAVGVASYSIESGDEVYNGSNFALAQYKTNTADNTDGALDSSFGNGGTLIPFTEAHVQVYKIAEQSDGKLVIASRSGPALARLNRDGTLDMTFGRGGKVTVDTDPVLDDSTPGMITSLAIQLDDKILVGIEVTAFDPSTPSGFRTRTLILRYNTDGSLDEAFGNHGGAIVDALGIGVPAMVIQSDGKIVGIYGEAFGLPSQRNVHLIRLNPNGTIDSSFGTSGKTVTPIPGNVAAIVFDAARQNDDKIVVVGARGTGQGASQSTENMILRFNANGTIDSQFGTAGMVSLRVEAGFSEAARAVKIQPDGKIVVLGDAVGFGGPPHGQYTNLFRFNLNGSLDTTFNGTGIRTTPIGFGPVRASGLALQGDGKIVTTGGAQIVPLPSPSGVFIMRHNSNGTLDTTFGSGQGAVYQTDAYYSSFHNPVIVRGNGEIAVASRRLLSLPPDWVEAPRNILEVRSYLGADGVSMPDTNKPPVVKKPLVPQEAFEQAPLLYTFAADTFFDPDGPSGSQLTYRAHGAGGDSTPLPGWLEFDGATRTFSGTPPVGSAGVFSIFVVATDPGTVVDPVPRSTTALFTITVASALNLPPIVVNPLAAIDLFESTAFQYVIPASTFVDPDAPPGSQLTYEALGPDDTPDTLPAWVTFDPLTLTFSGTPPLGSVGITLWQVRATDAGSLTDPTPRSAIATFTVNVRSAPNLAPVVQVPLVPQTLTEGVFFSYTFAANTFLDPDAPPGSQLTYRAVGSDGTTASLPAWIGFDTATRTFTGTPPLGSHGQFLLGVLATDAGTPGDPTPKSATGYFEVTVIAADNQPPVLNFPLPDRTVQAGIPFGYSIPFGIFVDPDFDPLTYSIDGELPDGVSFDGVNFSGTITTPGVYEITVIASDPGGFTASDTFRLIVTPALPAANVVWVDFRFSLFGPADPDGPNGPATLFGYDAFNNLQAAMDAVAAGGRIFIRPGTYSLGSAGGGGPVAFSQDANPVVVSNRGKALTLSVLSSSVGPRRVHLNYVGSGLELDRHATLELALDSPTSYDTFEISGFLRLVDNPRLQLTGDYAPSALQSALRLVLALDTNAKSNGEPSMLGQFVGAAEGSLVSVNTHPFAAHYVQAPFDASLPDEVRLEVPQVHVSFTSSMISERGGATQLVVTRNWWDRQASFTSLYFQDGPAGASGPRTTPPLPVSMSVGQREQAVNIKAIDNNLLDGDFAAAYGVAFAEFGLHATDMLMVVDDEIATLFVNKAQDAPLFFDELNQRSMVKDLALHFPGHVNVGPGAFELIRISDELGNAVTEQVSLLSTAFFEPATNETIVDISFIFGAAIEGNGSLKDGRYRLVIHGSAITDSNGQMLDGDKNGMPGGDYVNETIFRLFGDSDGDGDVDAHDYKRFRDYAQKVNRLPPPEPGELGDWYRWYFDFNPDSTSDSEDAAAFTIRFQNTRKI
ncbi:MAG: putative Ig domain-containing protein [Pirellulales bacterium]|nr:putative Ig domain-containing protein [Pirellulales bacterium]